MSERGLLPEELRRRVAADLKPVRPLPPPEVRALEVALWGVAALLAVPAAFGLRGDAVRLGVMLTWGAAVLEVVAGVLLVALALKESVPGGGIGLRRGLVALAGGVAAQAGVAVLTWMKAPPGASGHSGAMCVAMQGLLGLPALAISIFLVLRALPVRPPLAGALSGLGAGLLADGVWHLVCPVCGLAHVLLWHGGATTLMTAAGWLLGVAWQRRELRRLEPTKS